METELENVPAFVELSSHPVSQAFFSAAALRMQEEAGRGGFQKIMALIDELIHDNRRQIHRIRKINSRVQGQCLVTKHKLNDRNVFFRGQTKYFKTRGTVALEEKAEAVNVLNSRLAQHKSYKAILVAARARHGRQVTKWTSRINNSQNAVKKVNAALRAVNEWNPKTSTAFIQESISESAKLYTEIKKYPLTVPSEMIQLAANDVRLRKRLFEWLNLLKASILNNLTRAQSARNHINNLFNDFQGVLRQLRRDLKYDAKKLGSAIENYTQLIKVYGENEKIYQNLSEQNNLLIQANNKWCTLEFSNFGTAKGVMDGQLKILVSLRFWLRKNFHRVRSWLRKRYRGLN